jgi:histidine ammonia-lyase
MACHGARRLLEMHENLSGILAVEAMAAAQGIELRAPLKTSAPLQNVIDQLRAVCPHLTEDRIVSPDIENLAALMRDPNFDGIGGAADRLSF